MSIRYLSYPQIKQEIPFGRMGEQERERGDLNGIAVRLIMAVIEYDVQWNA